MTPVEVVKSATFGLWLRKLKDRRATASVEARIDRLASGNPGDVRPVGSGVSELRIDYRRHYRVYYVQKAGLLIVVLCGGDRASQRSDIERAQQIAAEWKKDEQAYREPYALGQRGLPEQYRGRRGVSRSRRQGGRR